MIRTADILLVDDSPGDIRLTLEALKESRITNNINIVNDGVEAINFLMKNGEYANAPTPDLILLDLNLPKLNGFEVLKKIKEDETLKVIPVVVLTTSQSERDILQSYQLYVNCFVSKPIEFDEFFNVIRTIEDFWFTIVKLPKP